MCLLAELAYMQSPSAQMQQYIDGARTVAQAHQKKGPIARANLAAASAAIMRREFAAAPDLARTALELYREIGDREGEAEALERLATADAMLGQLDRAITTRDRAAQIFADLGKRSGLGHLLFNASATKMQLGLLHDAESSLTEALEIFEALDNERGRAACASNLSMVRLLQGDAVEAKALALRSLEAARKLETTAIEAAALSNLGNAERELHEFAAALEHMQEAILLRERLGRPATFEELADYALTQLESGDIPCALDTARTMLLQAETSEENTVWPHYCYWIAARVFRAAGDQKRAADLLVQAHSTMRALEDAITEPASRTAFVALAMNRLIRAAAERGEWPRTAGPAAV
ncbi:MAG TPA: tetratricopeptide repeat protein [Candidatus Eremiobacteraceae bacterium]|nr:tetratricopeptide repeat protein [Candidatus Eremiobacteraceae bacterium]